MFELAHHGCLLCWRNCPYTIANNFLDNQTEWAAWSQWKGVRSVRLMADSPELSHQRDDQAMEGAIDSRRAERSDTGWLDLRIEPLVIGAKPLVMAPIPGFCLPVDDYDEPGLV